ncbi:MAG: 3-hydroxyacyl-CoA dehydrogenase family protein, partial [Pseudomonadales bacterium]
FGGFHMLLREGADHEQLDQVMEQWGWPMGPAWLTDVVGLDIAVHAGDVVANGFPDRLQLDYQSATHLLLESGRYGQKNGKGYYQYEKDEKGRPQKSADPEVKQMLAEHAVESKTFSEDELVTRMMVPMATEIARCLEDGIVGSPQEADQALLYGLGFPRFRGGICRWMDETGLARICEMADQYAHLGGIYQPTDTMRRMAENGDTWYGS